MKILMVLFTALFILGCSSVDENIKYKVLVKVIVVRDDSGQNPAPVRIEPELINQLYSAAGIRFEFSEPVYWDNTAALKGKKNLNQLTEEAKKLGLYQPSDKKIYMFFVDSVDGKKGPLGRGMMNGNILYNVQGDKPDRFKDAFVIAHESGHNLNLKHTVDDPDVPSDIVNVMGDGPFEQRLEPTSLHPSQIKTILRSRLVLPIK